MKITKKAKSIKASEETLEELGIDEPIVEEPVEDIVEYPEEVIEEAPEDVPELNPYGSVCDQIQSAIDILAGRAETDELARDAIANLSVVLFELK